MLWEVEIHMKQEMISYLNTIKDDVFGVAKYLYENPEESFNEYKAYEYILKTLKKYNFKVMESYLGIPTAFYAEYGNGHPKLCYICEYDGVAKEGHINGHNLVSSMSIGAALSLAKVIDHFENGTVVVIGCPGELINGTKVTMAKQGTFQDIDVVLMAHPDTENAFLNTSMALLPVKIKYYGKEALTNSVNGIYSSLDACAFTFNSLNFLAKGFEKNCSISELTIKSNDNLHLPPKASEINFNIRAPKMFQACLIEKKIKLLAAAVADLMEVDHDITMPELPYDEIVSNNALSRIFAHNLKEIGIIDTINPKDTFAGLSLGTLSHLVPCIQLYISIVKDLSIKYSTADFAASTISPFAQDNVLKAASALAMTGLDLLEKEELLQEVKVEFYENLKNHECTTFSQ